MFLWTPEGFVSQESFLNLFLNLYIPLWLRKTFKFMVLRLLQIHLWVKKLNLFIFTHILRQNSPSHPHPPIPPGICHSPPVRRELPIPPFFEDIFFWGERGRGLWSEKITRINKDIVTSFDKSHHLCNLVLLCNNLASAILKCEGSLT